MNCCLQKEKAAIQSYFAKKCSWKTVMLKENKSWSVSRLENLLRRTCVTTHFSIKIEEKRDECWKRWIKYPVLNMIIFRLTSSSGFFNDNSTSWINSEWLVCYDKGKQVVWNLKKRRYQHKSFFPNVFVSNKQIQRYS